VGFGAYRRVLGVRGVPGLLVLGVLGRIPVAASNLVLTMHVVTGLGRGYGAAGLVCTAGTVGAAIGSPWRGRAVDRVGLRRAVLPSVVVGAGSWVVAPFLPYPWLVVDCFVGGMLGVPIFTVLRQAIAAMVPPEHRRTAYATDSIGVEFSFLASPALGMLLTIEFSSTVALVAVGLGSAVSGIALLLMNPAVRPEPEPTDGTSDPALPLATAQVPVSSGTTGSPGTTGPSGTAGSSRTAGTVGTAVLPATGTSPGTTPRTHRAWAGWVNGQVLSILAISAGSTVVLAGTEVALIAHLRAHGAVDWTIAVFGGWSLASILGGLLYGAARRSIPALWLLIAVAVLTAPIGVASGPLILCLAVLPAGFACAPVISATVDTLSALVPDRVRGEAMGWHGAAMTTGMALGAPLAGAAVDGHGPWAGFVAVGAVGLLVAVVGARLGYRRTGVRVRPVTPESAATG